MPNPIVETPNPIVEMPNPIVETPNPIVEMPNSIVEMSNPIVEMLNPIVEMPNPIVETPNPIVGTSRDPNPSIDLTFLTPNDPLVTPSPVRHMRSTPNRTHDFVQSPTFSPRESPLFMVSCLFTQTVTVIDLYFQNGSRDFTSEDASYSLSERSYDGTGMPTMDSYSMSERSTGMPMMYKQQHVRSEDSVSNVSNKDLDIVSLHFY